MLTDPNHIEQLERVRIDLQASIDELCEMWQDDDIPARCRVLFHSQLGIIGQVRTVLSSVIPPTPPV